MFDVAGRITWGNHCSHMSYLAYIDKFYGLIVSLCIILFGVTSPTPHIFLNVFEVLSSSGYRIQQSMSQQLL